MLSIEERIKLADIHVAQQEHKKRVECRQERERKKKAVQRQNYVVGELVLKFFPQIIELKSIEKFLFMMASDPCLMKELKKIVMKIDSENSIE